MSPDGNVPLESHSLLQQKIGRYSPLFLMSLFLSQVHGECGAEDEVAVKQALQRLVDAICAAQQADGTWGNESWAPILGTVLGWECLRASASSGIRVRASTDAIGSSLLAKLKEDDQNADLNNNWMFRFYKETASLRVLYSLGYQNEEIFRDRVKSVLHFPKTEKQVFKLAGGEEYLSFFLITECLLKQEETHWSEWYPMVSTGLIDYQNRDGSWSGHHCITSKTFCTAAAILTLQAPSQCLPSSDF